MKKIISICMLCLFIALGSKAANTMSVLKNTDANKITFVQKDTEVKRAAVFESELKSAPLFWYCYETSRTTTALGEDMEGNIITETTVNYSCFWINNNLQ